MSLRILLPLLMLAGSLSAQITEVKNGASFGTEITAGSWAYLKGTFAGVTTTVGTVPVGFTLAGVTMTVNSVPTPVWYVSTTQINFLVPAALAPGVYPLQVKVGSTTYSSTIRLLSAAPGIFVRDSATPPRAAATLENYTENTPSNVALRGTYVSIYGTGPGLFKNPIIDGDVASSVTLNPTKSTPQVYVGGIPAEINFSGQTPTLAGVWQINVKVPNQVFITGKVPVSIFVDGVEANEVAIFVQ